MHLSFVKNWRCFISEWERRRCATAGEKSKWLFRKGQLQTRTRSQNGAAGACR